MAHINTSIERLIKIVQQGGSVRTGIDIYNSRKEKKIDSGLVIKEVDLLTSLKAEGFETLPISKKLGGGTWDQQGNTLGIDAEDAPPDDAPNSLPEIDRRIKEIGDIKRAAAAKYQNARNNIKKVISDIRNTGGEFDYGQVEETVTELLDFMNTDESAFSLLTREIFSYDDYLYNHAINVCTIGTPVLKRFMNRFGKQAGFYHPDKIKEISIGFFMHDAGKVLVPEEVLNKKGPLTDAEFNMVKTHSFELGLQILEKNRIDDPMILDSVKSHHAAMFDDEPRCYPVDVMPGDVPPHVKICKLADIYDAMTSKRCYKDACNPIEVVTDLYNRYAKKHQTLQYVLHAFVSVVGIYPPGSIVFLSNGQRAYLMDSQGPIVVPFTDPRGEPLKRHADPIDLANQNGGTPALKIDHRHPLTTPVEVYDQMPEAMRRMIFQTGQSS
jgi:HD-GYP domain-containing protein (c-di-GMP phosphodiesterase class II)